MFRDMTRAEQKMSDGALRELLKKETWGVLSLTEVGGYPYGVPVNYAYEGGKIYFHGTTSGHKWDAMQKNNRVSFTVVGESEIVEEEYTTAYASAILFGRVSVLEGEERKKALRFMTDRLAPSVDREMNAKTAENCGKAAVFSIDIEHASGKVGRLKIK
ncbi:MAG: pyridoxamine 5'-phosphate oxidase family protein [Peptoniphilus sp.]|nr:pyridoxamine 5'-phosphate oxidase family protein [Peptoniphilus sp.]MDD7363043.1 pyridoxamine 5'-phosphate oxidase family protein [Bacillota bacterium]MDY6045308.1 pyridoxamine 5'-phosphate oxidase family protein [Peptoniphilus sp.]